MAAAGNSASADFSSCNATTSGLAERSQRNRLGSRRLTLLMLKVAIFMPDNKLSGWDRRRLGLHNRRLGLRSSRLGRHRRWLRFRLAAFVDSRIALAEAGQY